MRRDAPAASAPRPPSELPAPVQTVLAALEPLLTPQRRGRIDAVLSQRSRAVAPVLDGLIDPHNVAAVLRSADAFGVQDVHFIARGQELVAARRVAQGSERWVDLVRHESPEACVRALHALGYPVYVAAMDGSATPDDLARLPRAAVVFGNEHAGVSRELAALADGSYAIPMRGFVQSLNVSVAAAITLFAATRGRGGDLTLAEQAHLRARYLLASVPHALQIVAEHTRRSGA